MKRSWLRSASFGFLSWLLPLGLTILATPLLVKRLGIEKYGLYALILGFIGYSFTFSVGRAITKYVAEYQSSGQVERIKDVLAATLWINLAVSLVGAFVLCFGARFIVVSLFEIKPEQQEDAIIALYLASISIFFIMQSQVFSGVIQAAHRLDVFSAITTLIGIFNLLGNIALVLAGFGVRGLLVWNSVNSALGCVWFYLAGKRFMPEAKWGLGCSSESLKSIAKFVFGITASQTIFNFLLLFERGLITRQMGTDDLTYYVIPMNLAMQIHFFSGSLLLMIFPLASELGARMEIERLRAIYEQVSKYLFAIVTFIVVSVSVCGYDFFRLWLGDEFAERTFYIVILQAVSFGMIAVGIVGWQIMEGFGFTRTTAFVACIWVTVSLILMVTLSPILKLEGIALGRMLGCISMLVYILLIEKWIFGKTLWAFWGRTLGLLLLPALFAFAVEYFSLHYFLNGWLGLFAAVGFGGLVYAYMLFATRFFTLEGRRRLNKLFSEAFPSFSQINT